MVFHIFVVRHSLLSIKVSSRPWLSPTRGRREPHDGGSRVAVALLGDSMGLVYQNAPGLGSRGGLLLGIFCE